LVGFVFQVIAAQDDVPARFRGASVAIGNFDGLHRGHQHLLNVTRDRAKSLGKPWGIVTFEPHPRSYFRPGEPVFRLTPPALKARIARAFGADFICILTFDEVMATTAPENFVRRHLVERLQISHLVTGYDFHFGKGRKGNADTLQRMGQDHGFGVTSVDQVTDDGDGKAPFSSSSIRSALRRGHVTGAAHELGYRWTVMGEVVRGDQRGRTIGFPTANIILEPGVEPYHGIYAVEARDAAAAPGTPHWQGAAYFGTRPTFNTNRTFLETYLLDQDIDLYGKTLMVSFHALIRGDKTFSSVGELIAQMKRDCEDVRVALRSLRSSDPLANFALAKLQRDGRI
jgi:riboflavin kinase / FMN adenylyltransferase